MIKKIILITAFVGIYVAVQAQEFVLGAKLGLTTTQVLGSDYKNFSTPDNYNGLLLGAYARIGFIGFFVQPEVLLRNLNFNITNQKNGANSTVKNNLTYVDVPVLFGKKFLKLIRLSAGPNFQFLVNKEISINNASLIDPIKEGDFNNFVLGAQAGIGVDVWKLSFDIRYDFSLSKIGEAAKLVNTNANNIDFGSRASMVQFSVGYRFLKLP
jgi:Outer membrane protein beta-barrel domain